MDEKANQGMEEKKKRSRKGEQMNRSDCLFMTCCPEGRCKENCLIYEMDPYYARDNDTIKMMSKECNKDIIINRMTKVIFEQTEEINKLRYDNDLMHQFIALKRRSEIDG